MSVRPGDRAVDALQELPAGFDVVVDEVGEAVGTVNDVDVRRALLDDAFKSADVRNLPGRPDGRHVVADLMAHYFRSSGANDLCYNARIGRNTYRAIRVTTVKPQPLQVAAARPQDL